MSNSISFNQKKDVVAIYLDDFVEILEEKHGKVYISKNVSICKDKNISFRSVISTISDIDEIDYDCKYDNEYCYITLKNGRIMTILKDELETTLIFPFKSLKENEDLIALSSLKGYKDKLPGSIKIETNESIKVLFDEEVINSLENRKNLSYLIGFIPDKIIDFRDKEYTIKTYEKTEFAAKIRYKFINENNDLKPFDNSFYEKIKIRISDNNTLKYANFIFAKTDNNNCIILSNNKKQ